MKYKAKYIIRGESDGVIRGYEAMKIISKIRSEQSRARFIKILFVSSIMAVLIAALMIFSNGGF